MVIYSYVMLYNYKQLLFAFDHGNRFFSESVLLSADVAEYFSCILVSKVFLKKMVNVVIVNASQQVCSVECNATLNCISWRDLCFSLNG